MMPPWGVQEQQLPVPAVSRLYLFSPPPGATAATATNLCPPYPHCMSGWQNLAPYPWLPHVMMTMDNFGKIQIGFGVETKHSYGE